ncbi:zinc carboxypeptidase, partial [Flavobacteriaceae bacterium]|nr:zinc carboxypeptidase [Flavobacteriaceae bacterium]
MKKYTLLVVVLLLGISKNIAQDYSVNLDYYLPTNVSYNPNIPTPKSSIGHQVGDWHITHDKLVQYMYALASSSDRITIEDRGATFEGRPLLLLTITSTNNHLNIETIRQQHL